MDVIPVEPRHELLQKLNIYFTIYWGKDSFLLTFSYGSEVNVAVFIFDADSEDERGLHLIQVIFFFCLPGRNTDTVLPSFSFSVGLH